LKKLIIESIAHVDETAKISGIALVPRISRNGNLYTNSEMARADGKTVPLNWEHNSERIIGQVTFHYNPELTQLMYEGVIIDEGIAALARQKELFVSIEADVEEIKTVCDRAACFQMPLGLNFTALGMTEAAGIPETSVNVLEAQGMYERLIDWKPIHESKCDTCKESSSLILPNSTHATDKVMAKEQNGECPAGQHKDADGNCVDNESVPKTKEVDSGVSPTGVSTDDTVPNTDCPEGFMRDAAGECVPVIPNQAEPQQPAGDVASGIGAAGGGSSTENAPCNCEKERIMKEAPEWAKLMQKEYTSLSGKIEKLAKHERQIGVRTTAKAPTPTAVVTDVPTATSLQQLTPKLFEKIEENGRATFTVPYEVIRGYGVQQVKTPNGVVERYNNGYAQGKAVSESVRIKREGVREALTLTNTQPSVDVDPDVAMVPQGVTFAPTRQHAKFKQVQQGSDIARFFKTTLPASGTQTVGTAPAEATQTITAIQVTPSAITGIYTIIGTDDMEDSPYDLMEAVVNASTAMVLDFEATDMLDTVSNEASLTAGRWIRGDTGDVVTSSDTASVAMDSLGIAAVREYFEDRGYLRGGAKPILALDAKQLKQLITDTGITEYTQNSNPLITQNGLIDTIYGVDLLVTSAIEHITTQTNPASNAIGFMPRHTYGAASKRAVKVSIHEFGEENQLRVNVTWRYKTGVIDNLSSVRVSTTT
jgi:hypothetical protein